MISASPNDRGASILASWKLLSVLLLLLLFKLFCALDGYPPVWGDEVFYTEPAVNFVQGGPYAAPGIDRQLETKGVNGLAEHYFLNVPIATYARMPVYEVAGANMIGFRLADWIFLVLATVALLIVLRRWVTPRTCILTGIVFATNRVVESDFGRPDVLSMAFGLVALFLVTKPHGSGDIGKPSLGRAYAAGFFIGLSGLTHQFGGIFWAVIVVAVQFAIQGTALNPLRSAQWMVCFGLGGLTGVLLWLPQIAMAPLAWYQQFSFMVSQKYHLFKNFGQSAHNLAVGTIGKNPIAVLLILFCPLIVGWRKLSHLKLWWTLVACLLLLAVWRCHSFEPVVLNYAVHFWAVICILFALAFDDLTGWTKRQFSANKAGLMQFAATASIVALALVMNYIPAVETCVLPYTATQKKIAAILRESIAPNDQVLAGPAFYYEVPAHIKSLWVWSEKLDLNDYSVVVAPFAPQDIPVSGGKGKDQWSQCFTLEQADVFRRDFKLVTNVPAIWFRPRYYPTSYQPHIFGCYLYRNQHPHAAFANPTPNRRLP
jgi:hypothetical protein